MVKKSSLIKTFVVGSPHEITAHLRWLNSVNEDYVEIDNIDDAELVVFTGGADVSPEIYDQKRHIKTHPFTERDIREFAYAAHCINKNIPMVGVCRGAQLLCVAAGGKLVQHTTDHVYGDHNITCSWGEVEVNSLHHQMMYPWNIKKENFKLLAWSSTAMSKKYESDKGSIKDDIPALLYQDEYIDAEPEVIYFKNINALGLQYHPEMMKTDDNGVIYSSFLVNDLMKLNGKEV